ncbi:MAG: hypothetical protein ACREGC_00280 [Minisyncoccia bacterium]
MALPVPEPAVKAGTLIITTGVQNILVTGSANTTGVVIGNGLPN